MVREGLCRKVGMGRERYSYVTGVSGAVMYWRVYTGGREEKEEGPLGQEKGLRNLGRWTTVSLLYKNTQMYFNVFKCCASNSKIENWLKTHQCYKHVSSLLDLMLLSPKCAVPIYISTRSIGLTSFTTLYPTLATYPRFCHIFQSDEPNAVFSCLKLQFSD